MPGDSLPPFFATTRWTLVRDAARGGDPTATSALEHLFGIYWQPLYRYARRCGKTREDAEDLVQGFLAHLLHTGGLAKTDPARGRFRSFLLSSFTHWMINGWKHGLRQKRGGGAIHLSFDWQNAETGLKLDVPDERPPDLHYDRDWAIALLDKVLADLESHHQAEGTAAQFTVLKSCLTTDSASIAYQDLATTLDITPGAARVAVHRLRKHYRQLIQQEIARTLASPEAVEDEMNSLFAALVG